MTGPCEPAGYLAGRDTHLQNSLGQSWPCWTCGPRGLLEASVTGLCLGPRSTGICPLWCIVMAPSPPPRGTALPFQPPPSAASPLHPSLDTPGCSHLRPCLRWSSAQPARVLTELWGHLCACALTLSGGDSGPCCCAESLHTKDARGLGPGLLSRCPEPQGCTYRVLDG